MVFSHREAISLAQEVIAKWSGRADARQNRVYNHMDEFEMVAMAEKLDPSLSLFGPEGSLTTQSPIQVKDLELVERGAVHVTEYGACVHDFTLSPCERFKNSACLLASVTAAAA
jgi:hypothetical protein